MQDTPSEDNPIYRYALHQPRVFTPFLGTEAERVFWDYFQESWTVRKSTLTHSDGHFLLRSLKRQINGSSGGSDALSFFQPFSRSPFY